MIQCTATVISNQRLVRELERRRDISRPQPRDILGSWILRLRCSEISAEARPGQYVMVTCGDKNLLPRPFSIHQAANREIAIYYAVLDYGKGTNWLSGLQSGDEVKLFGPLGNGFTVAPESRKLLLVAGGIGIAPLYFLARQAMEKGLRVNLLMGASGETKPDGSENPNQLYLISALPSGIQLSTMTSSPDGLSDMVTELVPEAAAAADQVFACGPMAMYHTMAAMPELQGKSVQVSLEVRMGCGRGICYGCTVKTVSGLKKVCADGPVFELSEVVF